MRHDIRTRWTGLGLALVLALAVPAAAQAQAAEWPALRGIDFTELVAGQPVPEIAPLNQAAPRTFGTASEVAHVVPASQFETALATDLWTITAFGPPTAGVFRIPVGVITLLAGVQLPAGALITRIELDGCDTSAPGQIIVGLFSSTSPAGATAIKTLGAGATGAAATPGCALFSIPLAAGLTSADLTVDNGAHYYSLFVSMNAPSLGFSNVRVFYALQVSPAPATATFGDVPTSHPFFQFIEALVKSGITAGCGSGKYCPDDTLTRGQMAVSLSKGLGLHVAP